MPDSTRIWDMRQDDIVRVDSMRVRDPSTGLGADYDRLSRAKFLLWEQYGILEGDRRPVAAFDPYLTLNLPAADRFCLDYFYLGLAPLCSARLRAALAQPPEVVQYIPLTVNTPEPRVRAMDYQIMRVLPSQCVIDTERSETRFESIEDRYIGGPVTVTDGTPSRVTLLPDVQPLTAMFRVEESSTLVYVTDAVAGRVMRAGCIGILFEDPEAAYVDDFHLVRTAKGVAFDSPAVRARQKRLARRLREQNG